MDESSSSDETLVDPTLGDQPSPVTTNAHSSTSSNPDELDLEETSEDEEPTTVPTFSTHTIYIPDFLALYIISPLSWALQNKELLKEDWLTPGLLSEIEALAPSPTEIEADQDNRRDPSAFQNKIAKLFPVGRIFASFKQLDQAADMFLSSWAIKKTHHGKCIQCSYSAPINKKRSHADTLLRRRHEPTLKSVYKCPFAIRYSYLAYCKNKNFKKPDVFYQVKITSVNYTHSCQMTTIFHRQAIQTAGGYQPDLNGLNDIISLLRHKPNLQAEVLRPLLLKYLPHYKATDAKFLCNFRERARIWLIRNGDKPMTMEEARFLSAKRPPAADEFLLSDDPMQKQNLTALLRTAMQNGQETWDALGYLREIKKTNPGFDFRVKYDAFKRPEGLCWMLPEMRCDLLRFGNILFLDSQKRQYNSYGWPYIGPVVKDSEMQVRCVAESIIVEESHRMYVWVTEMLADMEPRYKLSSIKIIFGDQALTDGILVDLGIKETCTLRGDYHHLINEVWPATFGTYLYHRIRGDLDRMLMGSKEEWLHSYHSAKKHLLHDAEKYSALEDIYNNHTHFAGWYLRKIEGNLHLNGSVPAEQNHASVAAHLGSGASWSVVEHVVMLHKRQVHLTQIRRTKDIKSYVGTVKYKSSLRDQAGYDDEAAKKQLSRWAYKCLFQVEFERSRKLQHKVYEGMVYVWPHGKTQDCEQLVVFEDGQKCSCSRRTGFVFQCRHELVQDGKFALDKYATRWLNRRTFNATTSAEDFQLPTAETTLPEPSNNPLFTGGPQPDTKFHNDDDSFCNDDQDAGQLDDDDDLVDSDSEDVTLSSLRPAAAVPKLSYQYVTEKATNLVRLAQSDPAKLGSICLLFEQLTERLQNGQSIEGCAFDFALPANEENNALTPVMGTLRQTPNAANHRRFMSKYEKRKNIIAKRGLAERSVIGISNDVNHLAPPKARGKSCTLCRCPGHQKGSCPKILMYKSPPLEMGRGKQSRLDLSSGLLNRTRYKNDHRDPKTDSRVISETTPKLMTGVVIHRRFYEKPGASKLCVECTILVGLGDAHSTFQKYLFTVETIAAYINRSKTNVIISELEAGIPEGMESMGFPLYSSQPNIDHQAQAMMFQGGYGYGSLSQQDRMGFGMSQEGMSEPNQPGYGMSANGMEGSL
jgi:hypothetical protein